MVVAAAAASRVCCIQYSDFSIHLTQATLHGLYRAFHDPTVSAILYANINVHQRQPIEFHDTAQRVLINPNAGGNSVLSEALSAELIDRLFPVHQIVTEMELQYSFSGPITDYACHVLLQQHPNSRRCFGVSVTRAFAFRRRFTKADALRILEKKLYGICYSSKSVSNCRFERQILHIWTENGRDAAIVRRACAKLSPALRSNTLILITTVNLSSVFSDK